MNTSLKKWVWKTLKTIINRTIAYTAVPVSYCKVSFWKGTIIKAKDGKGRKERRGKFYLPPEKCQPPFFHFFPLGCFKWAYTSLILGIGTRRSYFIPLKEFSGALREEDIDYTCALWSNMYLIKYPRWSNICKLKPFPPKPNTLHQNLRYITICPTCVEWTIVTCLKGK